MSNVTGVRIVNADFYMSTPLQGLDVTYSDFRASPINQVPVIRIFGSTNAGKKICLHIHGIFPYLYIPYDGSENANVLKYQIAANIDKAINVSFGQASSTTQHVYKICLVSGIPFYGYHAREHQFYKIFLYNPSLIRKVSNMLQSEVILGKLYQPHESHIPFIMQFMIDYNLHGMSKIMLSDLKFRSDDSNFPDNAPAPKQSFCELEADALSEHILNHLEISEGHMAANPGIAALWEDEKQRRRDQNEDSNIGPCLTLDNTQVAPTKSHLIFKRALIEKLALSENNVEKEDQNISVYPAETPSSKSLMNASLIDFHSPFSSQSHDESLDLNSTLDSEAKNLFEILQDLGENVEKDEEDSILAALSFPENEDESENEDDLDLSISLADTTPITNIFNQNEEGDNDLLDTTLVPQLDGHCDGDSSSSDEGNQNNCIKQNVAKKKITAKYGSLPICISSLNVSTSSQESQQRKTTNSKYDDVKRKLNFSNNLEVTICEEHLECQLRPQYKEKVINGTSVQAQKSEINKGLTTAEIYDLETNFKAKEGSSKKLTQNSDSNDLKLSSESNWDLIESDFKETHTEDSNLSSSSLISQPKSTQTSDLGTPDFDQNINCTSIINENLSLESGSNTSPKSITTLQLENDGILNPHGFILTPRLKPPTKQTVLNNLEQLNIPKVVHEIPFYSNVEDATGSIEIGQSVLKIQSKTVAHLEDYKAHYDGFDSFRKIFMPENVKWSYESVKNLKLSFCSASYCVITPVKSPPKVEVVKKWTKNKNQIPEKTDSKINKEKTVIRLPQSPGRADESDLEMSLTISTCDSDSKHLNSDSTINSSPVIEKNNKKEKSSSRGGSNSDQITGVTLNHTYGFKVTPENLQNAKAVNEYQYITILSLELQIRTRGDLKPDPAYDSIRAIFYSVLEDSSEANNKSGIIAINSDDSGKKFPIIEGTGIDCDVVYVESEEELFNEFIKLVHSLDPDIFVGYEIEMLSWGYLIERAHVIGINLFSSLSRVKDKASKGHEDDKGLKITGRIILDVWRLLRHEIALQSYTFESIVYHILHRRVPLYSFKDLSSWWDDSLFRRRTISYYLFKVEATLKILEQLDLIGRTSELARLFGILFFEVLSRGSQFRVESMMLRLAKPLNYVPVSPSVQQRAKMKAPEFLPLILEPESKLYVDPVIVLDFQSLYPSMIIAYNYCFSTSIGKVVHLGKNSPFEFGATHLRISRVRVQKLVDNDCLNFSPCGVGFVKSHIRDGILPRMLREILDTRLMVKNSMKKNKDDKVLQKVLHNRQLGLKLIANVTYGYTAANFSGRMPAVELGDSVVSKGRETLQRAIAMVENTPKWKAKVVYGDTDSLFVLIPGRSRSEAFEIGQQIADAVTKDNPDPVKLKLEKVYQPCILQTKKRYVGYMYESPDQSEPVYDAKGIETVRRDGCPAVAKMLEKSLRLLFETKNVSLVKKYVLRQFDKILTGRVSLQDLTFAKEYRGSKGYRPGACVPALELTRKWTSIDKRNEPRSGERVPYVIASGPPGVPLIRLVRSPRDFLNEPNLRPNAIYYITKVIIPPINRCFNLIGADLTKWFNQMPRKYFQYLPNSSPGKKSTISQYFWSTSCAACGEQTQNCLCDACRTQVQKTAVILHEKILNWEQSYCNTNLICQSCTGILDKSVCISLDCPVLYRLNQTTRDLQQTVYVRQVLDSLYEF